jgi:hypothetical protein
MKEISIYKDFQEDDLASDAIVKTITDKIDIAGDNIVKLDLRDCFIDYPYTSRIIDKILTSLHQITGDKVLTIIYDLNAKESSLLNWFFLESEFLGITNNEKSLELDDIKDKVIKKIKASSIKIELIIQYKEGSEILKNITYE